MKLAAAALSCLRSLLRKTACPYFLLTENPACDCVLLLLQYNSTRFWSERLFA